ncbi:phosphate ABC transporter permease PstA [Robiginitomaculum antarcticum]|uniref:phosphate ABC transporter permease PstA n=1 Tax=Robiginitomaculum antarcticum TaxID=437507 RepID=UPI00036D7953|nr:phosphate ABC transporter permease PstA [Robiginitomaculum antarcticum]
MANQPSIHAGVRALARLKKRRRSEAIFRAFGIAAIVFAMCALAWLLGSIIGTGYKAFYQHSLTLEVELTESILAPNGSRDPDTLRRANYRRIMQEAMFTRFPDIEGLSSADQRAAKRQNFDIMSTSGGPNYIRQMVFKDPAMVGQTITVRIPTSDIVDQYLKGNLNVDVPEVQRKISDRQIAWVKTLRQSGEIKAGFNKRLLFSTDSRDPELAGIASSFVGSLMTMFVTFLLAFPVGVGAAIWLDEFAPKNKAVDFIEININNLAAVPSIVFGLLGLAVLLNWAGMPRSAPIVGGIVLALRTFPTIIIATRSALRAVPPSIRDGALSVGASHVQAVFHHKLPMAAPGILTGSIIGMAQALGETAPLLMIGMVAFLTEIPSSLTEPATALPVQIYLWSDSAEQAWSERTSAAIIILLMVLVTMNGIAIWLRSRLEKRW